MNAGNGLARLEAGHVGRHDLVQPGLRAVARDEQQPAAPHVEQGGAFLRRSQLGLGPASAVERLCCRARPSDGQRVVVRVLRAPVRRLRRAGRRQFGHLALDLLEHVQVDLPARQFAATARCS